ncbi:MAG: hypothetical protein ACYTBP_17800, partial [Planctomycetota bacterium]
QRIGGTDKRRNLVKNYKFLGLVGFRVLYKHVNNGRHQGGFVQSLLLNDSADLENVRVGC